MSELEFLSPDRALAWNGEVPARRSPLASTLGRTPHPSLEDISLADAKLEVRGALDAFAADAELVPITPERGLVLCPYERGARVRAELTGAFRVVVDVTGALAGVRLEGLTLLRRLTDLRPGRLPAAGAVAGVRAIVVADGGERFRIYFPQEYGRSVGEALLDTARGAR